MPLEKNLDRVNRFLNPGEVQPKTNERPYYATGARCFIRMGGKPLGVCQDFKWTVGYNSTPTNTVDTVFPWDIEVGQSTISATLSKIIDPLRGPEADNLFPIMAAAVHQPMIELQVMYKAVVVDNASGKTVNQTETQNTRTNAQPKQKNYMPMNFSMFYARGMFTSISGNATLGQLSNVSATFLGISYQHYVSQSFTPYGFSYIAQEFLSEVQEAVGALTGGFG